MKKTLLIGTLAIITLASCKKDYTCTCTFATSGAQHYNYAKISKKNAKNSCQNQQTLLESANSGVRCEIRD